MTVQTPLIAMRPPSQVMRLARMGSMHQSRLSFMRVLLRRLAGEGWSFDRPMFDIDAKGVGTALYRLTGPSRAYTLVAFAHDLPADQRSDRVIATAWDATFALFDGTPTRDEIEELRDNVPKQEAGRISEKVFTLSRANRSVRLWEHVVDALSHGQQPNPEKVEEVGYLMRTTAVYGSGKFGAADRDVYADRPEFGAPFQAEMMTVYLIRTFVLDLVEHMARTKGGDHAIQLDPALRRRFGIGNSTGLGMAPFLLTHPILIHNWFETRERALALVRGRANASEAEIQNFKDCAARASLNANHWTSTHPLQIEKVNELTNDLRRLTQTLEDFDFGASYPWDRLMQWAETSLGLEGQEQLVSLLLEPFGDVVDGLSSEMSADEATGWAIAGTQTIGAVRDFIAAQYAWAHDVDWSAPDATARAWYVSQAKLEPRLGERDAEDLDPYEQPLQPARDIIRAAQDLAQYDAAQSIACFLRDHPEHRHAIRRIQIVRAYPYAEICDNTIDAEMMPIDFLRAKLSFFGAGHFDPRSDRWLRINMFQGAPFPFELAAGFRDDWSYPEAPTA